LGVHPSQLRDWVKKFADDPPHVRAGQSTGLTDHQRTQRPDWRFVGQPVGIYYSAVVAPARGAVNQKIAATMSANVPERDGFKGFAFATGHSHQPSFSQ
jgi:hypothetical protein